MLNARPLLQTDAMKWAIDKYSYFIPMYFTFVLVEWNLEIVHLISSSFIYIVVDFIEAHLTCLSYFYRYEHEMIENNNKNI